MFKNRSTEDKRKPLPRKEKAHAEVDVIDLPGKRIVLEQSKFLKTVEPRFRQKGFVRHRSVEIAG